MSMNCKKTISAASSVLLTAILSGMLLVSCDRSDGCQDILTDYVTAIPIDNGGYCYLLLNGETTLYPESFWGSPGGTRKTRAVIEYRKIKEGYQDYDYLIDLIRLDTIPTRFLTMGSDSADVEESEPIEIMRTSRFFIGDGYIHIPYGVIFGGQQTFHTVTLEPVTVKERTYELRLKHMTTDFSDSHHPEDDMIAESYIAFDLTTFPIEDVDSVAVRYKSLYTGKEERAVLVY